MENITIKNYLLDAIRNFEIIDCHEHLGPEKWRLEKIVDVFTLFSHYTRRTLLLAGLPALYDRDYIFDPKIPLEKRWELFKPYWERIRWTSFARSALIAAEKFYGFSDINDHTYQPLSEAIRKANQPGIYQRVLGDACKIRTALTQCQQTNLGTPLLTPVMDLFFRQEMGTWDTLSHPSFAPEAIIRSMDDYLDALRQYILRVKSEGAVGLKMASSPYQIPDRREAINTFESLRSGVVDHLSVPPERNPFIDYVVDQMIAFAGQQDLVVAVHTGYWDDFRLLDPLHMIPLLQRHPTVHFDIYHLGFPWVREALMLGKGFINVWLNLCWTHIISQRVVVSALDEAIDLVPINKLLAFGGDYGLPVEKVYGHLVMAQEDIAEVLARRVAEKQMTETQAIDLAHRLFWENPVELYQLKFEEKKLTS
jgi:predicted TIM-barrel fold metal-dependent hydrolase